MKLTDQIDSVEELLNGVQSQETVRAILMGEKGGRLWLAGPAKLNGMIHVACG